MGSKIFEEYTNRFLLTVTCIRNTYHTENIYTNLSSTTDKIINNLTWLIIV